MLYESSMYIHDLDKRALDALNAFPKFVKLQQAFMANYDEKLAKINNLSTAIRLNENQKPEVYKLLPPICEKLGIDVPELYMIQSMNKKDLNAATGGETTPYIYVTSELINQLPSEMIASVLAHECGHIACKHNLYHSMAQELALKLQQSSLSKIPAVRKYISPAIIRALLFWDRCSELSADRAAVICDGDANKTVAALLRVHGYDDSINVEEFIKQALDLKEYVNDSASNQAIEMVLTQWNSHPLLATRAYECVEWEKSDNYMRLMGNIPADATSSENVPVIIEEQEVVSAEVTVESSKPISPDDIRAIDLRLAAVNSELERYSSRPEKTYYFMAVGIGLVTGWMDSVFFSDTSVFDGDLDTSYEKINRFIQEYAGKKGLDNERLATAIRKLEERFPVDQDNVWKGTIDKVSAKNHHLADIAHHPTPLGLLAAIAVTFLRVGIFVNKDGKWTVKKLATDKEELLEILIPGIITGVLNWLVYIAEEQYEAETESKVPESIHLLAHAFASSPIATEVIKCAENWFGHLVSDVGGSKNKAGKGMGIPGVFLSLMYEMASLPILKETGLLEVLNDLYVNHKFDIRHEVALGNQVKQQALMVAFNEVYVRIAYMVCRLAYEMELHQNFKEVNWRMVVPFANRTVDRMLIISSMTFSMVDTADAAIRAATESGGNWVVFSGRFVARYNFVGAGRAALSIVREISNEQKESQLLHEKMILTGVRAQYALQQLQAFKSLLDEKVSNYLAEDIEAFIEGFDYMNEGFETGDSDLVIKGNVIIQKVLGREPQFTNQEEFDALMESDIPLQL